MDNENSPKRLVVPDIVKGVAIFGVVFTHLYLVPNSNPSAVSSGLSDLPMQLVYLGLMAFLVISGYFYRPRGFMYNMKKRILQLAVVYVACTLILPIIMYGYLSLLGYQMDFFHDYPTLFMKLIGGQVVLTPMAADPTYSDFLFDTTMGYYFVLLMICSFVLFYAMADLALSSRRNTLISIVVLILATAVICEVTPIHLPFQIESIPLTVAFMLFGAFLGREKTVEFMEDGGFKTGKFWILMVASLALAIVIAVALPLGKGFNHAYYGAYGGWSAFPYYIAGCAITVFALCLGTLFSKIPYLSTVVAKLGTHTFAILMLHTFIGKIIGYALSDKVGSNCCAVLSMPLGLLNVVLTLVIICFIAKYAPVVLAKITHKN